MTRPHLTTLTASVLDARVAVDAWGADLWLAVAAEAPECLTGVDAMTWNVTVQAFKNPGEPVLAAARRLGLYLSLHAETYGQPPRLESVQERTAEARHHARSTR